MVDLLIFIDESGDLGFKDKSSNYFIVVYIIIDSNNIFKINKRIKGLLHDINKKKIRLHEFKYSNDLTKVKERFVKIIPKLDIKVGYTYINKESVKEELKNKPEIIYNYVTIHYPIDYILRFYNSISNVTLVIDSNKTKENEEEAKEYFKQKVDYLSNQYKRVLNANIKYAYSHNEPCLQLADYIAGIIKDTIICNNTNYYNIIKDKILNDFIKIWNSNIW